MKLKDTPLEDQFVAEDRLSVAQPVYPLELALCESCGYLFLPHIISPEASYSDYVYVSGVTVGLRNHYDHYARKIIEEFGTPNGSLVVDLGSNDGSMLSSFQRLGMRVVGVEPARNIANQANQLGLTTINDFFSQTVASNIVTKEGAARIVTANYMYANIDDVIGFTNAVSTLLAPDGLFVVQTGYHPEQMKIKMFDYIYHEHFSYFTVGVLNKIFSDCGLTVIHAEKTAPKGGSIRVIGQLKNGARSVDPSVQELVEEELRQGIDKAETYLNFEREIANSKAQILGLLRQIKSDGKKIVGFGASHSTTTLIYHFELAPFLDYLIDDNQLKHELFSPGYHLPVYRSEKLYLEVPDYVLILAWQHRDSIVSRHQKYLESGGKFLVPLPDLQIVGAA